MCDDGADDHLNIIVELVTVICNLFICVTVFTSERVSDDTRRSAFHCGEISFELFMPTALWMILRIRN